MLQSISSEQSRVLGTFDPAACVVDFRESDLEPNCRPDAQELIDSVDATLLAHEFSHFLQMTNTIGGLTHYAQSVNNVIAMLQVVGIASQRDGPIPLPVNRHLDRFADVPGFAEAYDVLRDSIRAATAHYGGTASSVATESLHWLAWELWPSADPTLPAARMWKARLTNGKDRSRWIYLGFQQVAEGAAKAIELLREELEPKFPAGRNAPYSADALTDLAQPYLIAYYAYLYSSQRRGRRHRAAVSLLEFLTLADLAMSMDFLFLDPGLADPPSWLQAHLTRSPSNAFGLLLDLVEAIADDSLAMPVGQLDQDAIMSFQRAALNALCGRGASLRELAEATVKSAERIFERQDSVPYSPLSPALYEALKTATRRELNFRVEGFDGGPAFTFALWPEEDLRWMFVRSVPSFSNGSFVFALADVELASDAQEARFIAQTARNILFDDETCIWAQRRKRACLVAEQPLCNGLKELASAHKCGRQLVGDQFLRGILRSRVDWRA